MFGLELWFIFAVLSALIGGFGTFGNKIAAARKYSSPLIMTGSSLLAILFFWPAAIVNEDISSLSAQLILVAFLSGLVASFSSVMKIQVLHYIDSAIFLPLFKVVGPMIVVLFGMIFFSESFTPTEWLGIIVSLLVPVMLISNVEHARQNNLNLGLLLILVAAVTSAIAAALQKFATELNTAPLTIMAVATSAVMLGAFCQFLWQQKGVFYDVLTDHISFGVLQVISLRALFANTGMYLGILAFTYDGPLGIVYTITSLYIIPPIILAIIYYGEHWNMRKALAISLSILALALLH